MPLSFTLDRNKSSIIALLLSGAVFFFVASPSKAQSVTDPSTITLDERNLKTFRENREALIMNYWSILSSAALDNERLELSTLDAFIATQNIARRGRLVGDFLGYDLNWDGNMTRAEFETFFSLHLLPVDINENAWDEGVASKDLNGDGIVAIEELQEVALRAYPNDAVFSKELTEMRNWDLDGDGFVTQTEIIDVINANTVD